jgi:GAF domain-containing protein
MENYPGAPDSVESHGDWDRFPPSTQSALDRITCMAGEVLKVAAVCASMVDPEGQLVTSSYGMPVSTALLVSHSFRKHLVISRRPLVVADGPQDPLVSHNPVVRDGTVRACVGMPLQSADGRAIGTLLAMDAKPRWWTDPQLALMNSLSTMIVREIELLVAVRRASRYDVSSESFPAE